MNEKTQTQSGAGSVEREARGGSEKEKLQRNIKAIREGHTTGGYCDTAALHTEEKKLDKILRKELEEAKAEFGYSPDPKFKHQRVREAELALNGLSWKPQLVVKE